MTWPVPYWLVDTAMSSMLMLLARSTPTWVRFFGIFDHEDALLRELGVPAGYQPIGHHRRRLPGRRRPDPSSRGGSAWRGGRPLGEVVPRRWLVTGPGHDPEPAHLRRATARPSADPANLHHPNKFMPHATVQENDRLGFWAAQHSVLR